MKQNAKRLAIIIFSLMLLASLAACGGDGAVSNNGSGDGAQSQPQPTEADDPFGSAEAGGEAGNGETGSAEPTEPQPLTMDKDLGIAINGVWFPIWQDASGLIQALGSDYELYAAPSCVFDEGDDKEFAYDGIYVYTNPVSGQDIWYSVFIESSAYSTSRGISVGSALDDIMAAYDDGFYWEGDTILTYSISGIEGDISSPCIQFTIADQIVTAIEIYYPTNTT